MLRLKSFEGQAIEHVVDINSTTYEIIDGNRLFGGNRRKWGRHFRGITAVLYAVDLDEYDLDPGDMQFVCTVPLYLSTALFLHIRRQRVLITRSALSR
jgi:hypothetical protein